MFLPVILQTTLGTRKYQWVMDPRNNADAAGYASWEVRGKAWGLSHDSLPSVLVNLL